MDYTDKSLPWRIRKFLRYAGLYGIRRTLCKVEGQYHMKKRFEAMPEPKLLGGAACHVGIIGCGNFAYTTIAYFLNRKYGQVLHAAMDKDIHKAASLYLKYSLNYYTDEAAKVIADPAIDLIYIASNHASHAEYAISALEAGKAVHIEKPHVISEDQLLRLCRTMRAKSGSVRLGFNRPLSPLGRRISQTLSGQSGPLMMNWFIAGHELSPDHWYFKEEEGGRIVGNLCHWIEFAYQMVPKDSRYPIQIRPTRSSKSDSDIAVSYCFGDGSVAVVSFSAKGHTFEGVKERLSLHKGDVLMALEDFKVLTVEENERKRQFSLFFRDHGHEASVLESYKMVRPKGRTDSGSTIAYVWEVGDLIVKTKKALDTDTSIVLKSYDESQLE